MRPEFTDCPVAVRITVDRLAIRAAVTWPTPVVTDNVDTFIEPYADGVYPGATFSLGVHEITYTARDAERNYAFPCTFIVIVRGW